MAVGDSANVNIGTYNFLTGTNYNIDAYTSNPNGIADVVNTNDTIIKTGIYVNASPLANVIPSGAINICQNDSLLLMANTDSGLTYQWFKDGIAISGETDTSLTVKQAGSYMVNVTNSGCSTISNTAIVTLLQSPSANANALGPTTFCYGDSVFITANIGSGLTYQWKKDGIVIPSATSTTIYAKQSGAYTVTTTNLNFCSTISNTVVVSVSSLPIATATAQGVTTICYGDSVLIIANIDAGLTYQWKKDGVNISGATDTLIYAKQDGAYTVTTTNINSCSNTSTPIIVTVNPLPVIDLGPDSTICETHQIILDAGAGMDSYLWSTGDTTQTIMVDSSGIGIGNKDFSVIVTQQGCDNSDTIKVTVMDCSGISENIKPFGINIYPNPSQGKINIDIPDGLDGLEITVFNSIGQKILSELITSQTETIKTIDLSELPKGLYYIGLKSEGEQQFSKVILN